MRNDLISKGKLLNKIAQECHYNTEEPLQSYAKLLAVINDMETEGEEKRSEVRVI